MSQTKTKYKITRIETVCIEIEAEDDAEMRALYTDGTVDDHCSDTLWNDPDLTYSEYVYEVDGNVVDIWKEERESDTRSLMNEYQKLEWLHSQISELIDGVEVDLETMQSFIEDLREPYLEEVSDE